MPHNRFSLWERANKNNYINYLKYISYNFQLIFSKFQFHLYTIIKNVTLNFKVFVKVPLKKPFFLVFVIKYLIFLIIKFHEYRFFITGLPHTEGVQGNSGNFQVEENLRETQEILIYFLNSGKLREVLIFIKKSGKF